MTIRRYRPAGVEPLEVWDVIVGDSPLSLVAAHAHAHAVAEVVGLLKRGEAVRLRGQRLPALPVDRVVVAGGGPVTDVAAALVGVGIEAAVAAEPVLIARRGGLQIARESAGVINDVLVVDVGQTSVKCFYNHRNDRVSRPGDLLFEVDTRKGDPAIWRQRCINFIAHAGWSSLHEVTKPKAIVLGLPCEIADDLVVAGCSYPWSAGDRMLIADLVAAAGLEGVPAFVLNDAELAAVSVAAAAEEEARAGTLVLTVGLGVGAAFLSG